MLAACRVLFILSSLLCVCAPQNFSPEQLPSYSKALHLLLAKGADLSHTNRCVQHL